MLTDEFLPIRSVQFVLFCLVPLAVYATYKRRALAFLSLYAVAAWLLYFKISQYAGSGQMPMDISAVCYFLFGFCVLLPVRPAKVAVAQLCTLCGLVYGVSMLIMPQTFSVRDPSEIGRYFAVVNHSLLFFGGLVMMTHVGFKWTDLIWTLSLLFGIVVYTEVCIYRGVQEGTAVFSQIANGSIIHVIAPGVPMTWWYYVLYYLVVFALFALWIRLTYALNRMTVPNDIKRGFFAV